MNFLFKNFRYLLKRFKTSSVLIVIGLSVAFAVFITVMIQLRYDFNYDRSYRNTDNILKFSRVNSFSGGEWTTTNQQFAEEIKDKIPEIAAYCLTSGYVSEYTVMTDGNADGHNKFELPVLEVTPGFMQVFTPEIVQGESNPDFTQQDKAVISEKTAKILFGSEDPIGKVFYVKSESQQHFQQLTVTSVYKDFPKNSSLENGIYMYMKENTPENWSYFGYFLVDKQNQKLVEDKINSIAFLGEEQYKYMNSNPEQKVEFKMSPLKDLYLYSTGSGSNRRINTSLSLLAIGVVIILIAFINFINFSVAMAPSRVKMINIHKILGIDKLWLQFSINMEGVFLAFLSLFFALVYLYFLQGSALINTFVSDFDLTQNISLLVVTGFSILLLAFLFGIYPAHYVTSFNEVFALSGSFALTPVGIKLRNTLIVIQFIAAIALMSFSTFIKMQNDFMQNYDWGLQKENIVYVNTKNLKTDKKSFGEELKRNPSVFDYTYSQNLPGSIGMSWGRDFEGKYIDYFIAWVVAPNFLDFFGVKLTAGNNFTETTGDSTATQQIIFNQKFLEKNELGYDIIGKKFPCMNADGMIRGVISDINFESLHTPIKPMGLVVYDYKHSKYSNIFFLKISGKDVPQTINYIKNVWEKFDDDDFNLKFLDQSMNELYKRENNLGTLIGFFGGISILIAIMGIYGLILFNTRYKRKEIAIRKINGSSEWNVVFILNKSLLYQLVIAFLIASLIAYYVVQKWLENFAYRTPVYWWVFALSGLVVALITIVTVSWQSWHAATANPVNGLKNE